MGFVSPLYYCFISSTSRDFLGLSKAVQLWEVKVKIDRMDDRGTDLVRINEMLEAHLF